MNRDAPRMLQGVPEALRPLLPELFAALREALAAAEDSLSHNDVEGVRVAAHGLKGAAMRFGLTGLALEAGRAGDSAEKENAIDASKALARFGEQLAQLEASL